MITRWLGSWPGIAATWAFCAIWLAGAAPLLGWEPALTALTLVLSVVALTFTQLVLREQCADVARHDRKLDAVIHGTDADDGVADS